MEKLNDEYMRIRPKLLHEIREKCIKKNVDKITTSCLYFCTIDSENLGIVFSQNKIISRLTETIKKFLLEDYLHFIEEESGHKLRCSKTLYDNIVKTQTTDLLKIINEDDNDLMFVQYSTVDSDHSCVLLDEDDLIITKDFCKTSSSLVAGAKKEKVINKKGDLVGFKIGEHVWSFKLREKDELTSLSRWDLLRTYLTKPSKESHDKYSKDVSINQEFEEQSFASMLMSLKKWYYVEGKAYNDIDKKYDNLFEEKLLISGIKKHNGIDFIASNYENGTILGGYNDNSTGEKEDNLQFWVYNKEGQKCDYPLDDSSNLIRKRTVYTLKPEISFYLLKCFGEDFVEYLLHSLQNNHVIRNVLRNVELSFKESDNKREIDFFVHSNNDKIYKIEVKRTLSEYNIRDQLKKDGELHDLDYRENKIIDEYLMIGFKADNSCFSAYHYFIDEQNGGPSIDLSIPLFGSKEKKKLRCISEPSFEVLKNKLVRVFNQ
jgi:hypothetical protein